MSRFLLPWLFVACSLVACHSTLTGYPFSTRAVYLAKRTGIRVEVVGSGHVLAGDDVTDTGTGRAYLCPFDPARHPLLLEFGAPGTVAWTIESTPAVRGVSGWTNLGASLEPHLRAAGYVAVDAAERDELVRVIGGVLSGPKGTFMRGQTRALEVVATHFDRSTAVIPARASPCGSF